MALEVDGTSIHGIRGGDVPVSMELEGEGTSIQTWKKDTNDTMHINCESSKGELRNLHSVIC
jgi:hypothetical protein